MYLYDKKEGQIIVYSMKPNMDKIYKFRKEQIQSINESERILKMVSNKPMDLSLFYTGEINALTSDFKKKSLFKPNYFDLIPYNITESEKIRQNNLLENYYKSNDFYYKIKINNYDKIKELKTIKWLLSDNVCLEEKRNKFIILDIISIPESVYLLELILSENFNHIKDEDISMQLNLFDIKTIENIYFCELKKYMKYDVIPSTSETIIDKKINNSEKILKYIRK